MESTSVETALSEDTREFGTIIKTYHDYHYYPNGAKTDVVVIIYIDKDGNKQKMIIDRPSFDYYIIKDKNSPEAANPPMYISKDMVEKRTVFYDDLYHDVAKETGTMDFFNTVNFSEGPNGNSMKNILKHNWLYNADQDIEDYYIGKFYKQYRPNPDYVFKKCYFDTETDFYSKGGLNGPMYNDFPSPDIAPCPFNVITLIYQNTMTSYTFILRNEFNPKLTDLEKSGMPDFEKYVKDKISKEDSIDLTYNFYFFSDELSMLKAFFAKVHEIGPDYLCGWNANGFDIPYIINRLRYLVSKDKTIDTSKNKYQLDNEVAKIVCDDVFEDYTDPNSGRDYHLLPKFRLPYVKKINFTETDKKNKSVGKTFDWLTILDGTCWIDQMQLFACTRIQTKFDSYKLDAIAEDELGKHKLEDAPGETIRNKIYINPKGFIEYNIRDVLLLLELEMKNKDIEEFQNLSDTTLTRKNKTFSQSITLINFILEYADRQNLVMKTNKNMTSGQYGQMYNEEYLKLDPINETDDRYLKLFNRRDRYGAFVSNPNHISPVGNDVAGKPSNRIFDLVCDEDYSSLYPSVIRTMNLDSSHIVGKFYLIDDKIKKDLKDNYDCQDMFKLSKKNKEAEEDDDDDDDEEDDSDDAASLIDDDDEDNKEKTSVYTPVDETDDLGVVLADFIMSQDWCKIGTVFMDLPNTNELMGDIDELKKSKNNK
jgi:hypothetical protein